MSQEKKLTLARWIAGGCVVLALFCAVIFLRGEKEPAPALQTKPRTTLTVQTQPSSPETAQTQPWTTETFQTQPQPAESAPTQPETTVPPETEPISQPVQPPTEKESEETQPIPTQSQSDPAGPETVFPYALEDGAVLIQSLFRYSGINPDAGDRMAVDVAGLVVTNTSDRHLEAGRIEIRFDGETSEEFLMQDLKPGATAMVFSSSNRSLDQTDSWQAIEAQFSFTDTDVGMEDQISVSVDGTRVTLTNLTQENLQNLNIYCHSTLNGEYFGGKTYCYEVDLLPGGGSVEFDAWDCYLDRAEVVRIEPADA